MPVIRRQLKWRPSIINRCAASGDRDAEIGVRNYDPKILVIQIGNFSNTHPILYWSLLFVNEAVWNEFEYFTGKEIGTKVMAIP